VLMNIECSQELLTELESAFRFNDAVLRHLTLTCDAAITEKSAMMKEVEREESAKSPDRKPAPRSDNAGESSDSETKAAPAAPAAPAAATAESVPAAAAAEATNAEPATTEAGVE
jgi:hypothetical protein